jgi:hypothetical protein
MQVVGPNPPERGGQSSAGVEIPGKRDAMTLRQRDADERANQGPFGFQCSGIQVRGEVGRKLK